MDEASGTPVISGIDNYGELATPSGEDPKYNHAYSKSSADVWKAVSDIVNINFTYSHSTTTFISGKEDTECNCREEVTNNFYRASGNKNNTQFLTVEKAKQRFNNGSSNIYSGQGSRRTVPIEKKEVTEP